MWYTKQYTRNIFLGNCQNSAANRILMMNTTTLVGVGEDGTRVEGVGGGKLVEGGRSMNQHVVK